MACVKRYGLKDNKTIGLSITEETWFYNTITLPGSEEGTLLKESRAALFFTLCAPKIPSLWADMIDKTSYLN